MLIGQWLMVAGAVLAATTIKRPVWLGGPERRYFSDDSAFAVMKRSGRVSTGMYLFGAGALMWLLGL